MADDSEQLIVDVGRRIAELRAARSLTQAELAEGAGVSVKYVQRVEAGQENLTIRTLAKFAELLEVRVVELFSPPASRRVRRGRPPRGE